MEIATTAASPDYEAYYDDDIKCYWIQRTNGHWVKVNETHLKRWLVHKGFNGKAGDDVQSEVDAELVEIVDQKTVIYAGPLAGHQSGLMPTRSGLVLVTSDPCGVVPDPTVEWSELEDFITGLLGDQDVYFYSWLKIGYEALYYRQARPGQVLVLAGDVGSGKSLLQSLVTEVFGREGKPFRYMSGGTEFNGDMFAAEHLAIGDEACGTDMRSRKKFGQELKKVAAETVHQCHKKGRDGFPLKPIWRCSISCNLDSENILVLPPMDESLADKFILLKCEKQEFKLAHGNSVWDGFKERLIAQLPGLAAWLLSIDVPEHLSDGRWGVKAWHHPDIMKHLSEHSPEEHLWDLIEETIFAGKDREVTGTATYIQACVEQSHQGAGKMFSFATACGVYLGRLAEKKDGRVERAQARSTWHLKSLKP